MDMKYYWSQDRNQEPKFKFYWKSRAKNLPDPFTKYHSTKERLRYR